MQPFVSERGEPHGHCRHGCEGYRAGRCQPRSALCRKSLARALRATAPRDAGQLDARKPLRPLLVGRDARTGEQGRARYRDLLLQLGARQYHYRRPGARNQPAQFHRRRPAAAHRAAQGHPAGLRAKPDADSRTAGARALRLPARQGAGGRDVRLGHRSLDTADDGHAVHHLRHGPRCRERGSQALVGFCQRGGREQPDRGIPSRVAHPDARHARALRPVARRAAASRAGR